MGTMVEVEGGGSVEYEVAGSGPPLVLLHSLLTDAAAFSAVVPALSERRTVYRLDLPGFGGSSPIDRASISDYSDRIVAAVTALGLGEVALLGNGFGSFVATMAAARHGHMLRRLIACNTGIGFTGERREAFVAMARRVETGGMSAIVDAAVARIFPPRYLDGRPELEEERRAVLHAMDPAAFATACLALASLDLTPQLPSIRVPTLVIAGELDQTTPASMAGALAAGLVGSRLVVLPECGHCPQIEQPEALVAALTPFLDEEGPR